MVNPVLFIITLAFIYSSHYINGHTYTQTEAYLRVMFRIPQNKELTNNDLEYYVNQMFKNYGTDENKIKIYQPLFMQMIENEKKYKNMYVFYHAYSRSVSALLDMQRYIYNFFTMQTNDEDIPLLRDLFRMKENWEAIFPYTQANDFLNSPIQPSSKYEDNKPPLMDNLLSVNLAIFANLQPAPNVLQFHWYSSYAYFDQNYSRRPSNLITTFFDFWGFDKKYQNQIRDLYLKILEEGVASGEMLQIFIPENLIDQLVYAAGVSGYPFGRSITNTFNASLNRHTDMLSILMLYRSNPYALNESIINKIQGRILLIPDFFDPKNGIKIFRYNASSLLKMKEYHQQLRAIMQNVLIDWLKTPKSGEMIKKFNIDKDALYKKLGLINYEENIIALNNDLALINALVENSI